MLYLIEAIINFDQKMLASFKACEYAYKIAFIELKQDISLKLFQRLG